MWDFEGGVDKARERLGAACQGTVATTLSEAIAEIRRIADSELANGTFAQLEKS